MFIWFTEIDTNEKIIIRTDAIKTISTNLETRNVEILIQNGKNTNVITITESINQCLSRLNI